VAKTKYKAKWIWIARERHSEDCYVRARRVLALRGRPVAARLRIAAAGEYELHVNGRYVGRGPAPSSAREPLVDVYTEADFRLGRGPNVIAVLAHNYHVGLPRLPRVAAGLWIRLDVTYAGGGTQMVATDRRWRMATADDFSRRAPRVYWTAGFAEVRDLRREPGRWTAVRFADRRWSAADEVSPELPADSPPLAMRERPTPRLVETYAAPRRLVATGRVRPAPGATALPFEFALPDAARGEFYAATFVHSKIKRKARLLFDCDEAAAVYVNNRQVPRQGYDEAFAAWLDEEEHDAYSGIHRGQGHRVEAAVLTLDAGWNSVGVVVYDPGSAWGFAMRLDDPRTGRPLRVAWSPDKRTGGMAHWHVVHDQLCPCGGDGGLPDTPAPNERTFPDPAYQLAWEVRKRSRRAARGASSLVGGAAPPGKPQPAEDAGGRQGRRSLREGGPLVLGDGEFAAYFMGGEVVGYVEIDLEGEAGAMIDLVWSESPGPGGDLEPVRRGLRQVDRLILGGGRRTVRFFNRRALAYLELVGRSGGGEIRVHRLGVRATSGACDGPAVLRTGEAGVRPPARQRATAGVAVLQADDRRLAGAMKIIARTVRCCLQHTFEGSPAREAEQSLPAAFLLAQAERTLCGRTALGEAALRAFAADQREDGFFRGIVPSGTVHTVPDWNLLWVIWLAEHAAWTGDRGLAEELYPAAERCIDWTAQFRGFSGLLENRADLTPWWLFVDASPMDKRGEVTAWQALYVRALHAAADVAEMAGHAEAAAHNRVEADAVAKAARERLWDPVRGLFVDARLFDHRTPGASAATNYYALYGRLATDQQAARILENLPGTATSRAAGHGTACGPARVAGAPGGRACHGVALASRAAADWGPRENPYVKYFALEALLERGMAGRALDMIRAYWGAMHAEGLTTVPEFFPLGEPRGRAGRPSRADRPGSPPASGLATASPPGRAAGHGGPSPARGVPPATAWPQAVPGRPDGWPAGSSDDGRAEGPYGTRPPQVLCHGWGVHPASLIAKWILGVRPGGPGFEPALLAPMPGDLDRAKGRAWTPRGPVDVEIEGDGRGRMIRFTVPEELTYRLDRQRLAEGDKVVITGGEPAVSVP